MKVWFFTFWSDSIFGIGCKQTWCKKIYCMNSQFVESYDFTAILILNLLSVINANVLKSNDTMRIIHVVICSDRKSRNSNSINLSDWSEICLQMFLFNMPPHPLYWIQELLYQWPPSPQPKKKIYPLGPVEYCDHHCLSVCLFVCPITLLVNTLSHQCIGGECWYVTWWCPLVWPRRLTKGSDCDKLLLVKMWKNLSIYREGQGHMFTFDLFFFGQHATLRGPVFSALLLHRGPPTKWEIFLNSSSMRS